MPITIGTLLGSHEITALLGKGGMGEVYRARDTKLKREVAIKILPEEFARDADRVTRFQREAEVLASLNHPNIAGIHDLQEANGSRYLVLELVEGETLAGRINRGPIPIEETLNIAKSICEALEAAHEKGIIHRDLKPGNVKIAPDGKVKVLDFGLAKAMESTAAGAALSNSPTLVNTLGGTSAGVILGTAAYMSPEQAKGLAADPRSDVFSFGCVLYEMLTGRAAFEGETVSEIIASVLKSEPDLSRLPANLPQRLTELLQRTLAKSPRRRLHSIADVRLDIEYLASSPAGAAPAAKTLSARTSKWRWISVGGAAAAFGFLAALGVSVLREKPAARSLEMRLEINTPSTQAPLEFAISPNGRYLTFVASGDGVQRLWLRSLDKTDVQSLPGTDNAEYPFWSGDSRSIGFYALGKLKRIDISGGFPQVLANAATTFSGTWNSDGVIIFTAIVGPLSRVNAAGGDPVALTHLRPGEVQHRFPRFLPDGRHFLYYGVGTAAVTGIYLASLDGGETKRLTPADSAGEYLPPDMIVYGRGNTFMAQHLDLKRGELTGDPVRVADFAGNAVLGLVGLSISNDGKIVLRSGGEAQHQLRWYDRSGKPAGVTGTSDPFALLYPELSPDQRQVAVTRTVQSDADIWLMDLMRGGMTRLTFDASIDVAPIWSPDGSHIVFASSRTGPYNLYMKLASNAGPEETLLETPDTKYPQDFSKDSKFLLYSEINMKTGRDLIALRMSDHKAIPVAKTQFDEFNGQFSPDGRFVAYQTNESQQFEVVVQAFPEPTGKWQVSTAGGTQPRWRADGKELYFIAPAGKLMAVPISVQGTALSPGTPVALFPALLVTGLGANRQEYAVTRDGRFLLNQPADTSTTTPMTLILNWVPKP
jgi:Tol biopolymer transport system component